MMLLNSLVAIASCALESTLANLTRSTMRRSSTETPSKIGKPLTSKGMPWITRPLGFEIALATL